MYKTSTILFCFALFIMAVTSCENNKNTTNLNVSLTVTNGDTATVYLGKFERGERVYYDSAKLINDKNLPTSKITELRKLDLINTTKIALDYLSSKQIDARCQTDQSMITYARFVRNIYRSVLGACNIVLVRICYESIRPPKLL